TIIQRSCLAALLDSTPFSSSSLTATSWCFERKSWAEGHSVEHSAKLPPMDTNWLHLISLARLLPRLRMRSHSAGHLTGRTCSSPVWHLIWYRSGKLNTSHDEETSTRANKRGR